MTLPFAKTGFSILSTLCLSFAAWAYHPVEANIEIDHESLKRIRLSHVQLRHDDQGVHLNGKVRRRHWLRVPLGHFDLVATNVQGDTVYEDAQYYWPRVVNRRYKYPSKFVFALPEDIVNSATLRLRFHKKPFASKPTPKHIN